MTDRNTESKKELLFLAIPLIFQRLVSCAFSGVDTLMMGQLGEAALSGVNIGSQWLWILNRIFAGLSAGGLIFFTQYQGSSENGAIRSVFADMISVMLICAGFFSAFAFFFPGVLLSVFGVAEASYGTAAAYLRISAFSFLPLAVYFSCSTLLISCRKTWLTMIAGIVNVTVHFFTVWFMVFRSQTPSGNGAAYALLFSALAGIIVMLPAVVGILSGAASRGERKKIGLLSFFRISATLVAHEGIWGLGVLAYNIIFNRLDAMFYAAVIIWRTVNDFFFSVITGLSSAEAIRTGYLTGRGDFPGCKRWCGRVVKLNALVSAAVGAVLLLFAPAIVSAFNLTSGMSRSVIGTTVVLVRIFGVQIILKAIPHTFIESVFRAAGDPDAGLKYDTLATWGVTVPVCLILVFVFRVKSGYPVFLAMVILEDAVKTVLCLLRFRTGKWWKPVIKEKGEAK